MRVRRTDKNNSTKNTLPWDLAKKNTVLDIPREMWYDADIIGNNYGNPINRGAGEMNYWLVPIYIIGFVGLIAYWKLLTNKEE